jgi:hypothetical protein
MTPPSIIVMPSLADARKVASAEQIAEREAATTNYRRTTRAFNFSNGERKWDFLNASLLHADESQPATVYNEVIQRVED